MGKMFKGVEFLDALARGELQEGFAQGGPIIREGMVKREESEAGTLLFSEGSSCRTWTCIPAHMIEQVELIRTVDCRDHQHPFVRLHLKAPMDNSDAGVFASLLKNASMTGGSASSAQSERMGRRGPASQAASPESPQPSGSLQQRRAYGTARGRLTTTRSMTVAHGTLAGSPRGRQHPAIVARPSSMRAAGVAEDWESVARFDFGIIDEQNCFILDFVEVYRQASGSTWDYKVGIVHGGVIEGGSCDCFPGEYRTGWVEARVDGTDGGYLDTGGLDVHSGGGEVWQIFYSIYPGELQTCSPSYSNWCTS